MKSYWNYLIESEVSESPPAPVISHSGLDNIYDMEDEEEEEQEKNQMEEDKKPQISEPESQSKNKRKKKRKKRNRNKQQDQMKKVDEIKKELENESSEKQPDVEIE